MLEFSFAKSTGETRFETNVLRAQLEEAVAALNERDVIPVLLKGSAILAAAAPERRATRIMADLDILVDPDQFETALQALADLDYQPDFRTPPESRKQYADLKRARDVGMIDLHQEAPGPDYFYRSSGKLLAHCTLISVGRGTAYLPTATFQAFMLIIHDQFQDRDYWVGEIDVRHMVELRDLASSAEGIDWNRMMSFATSPLARNAIEKQLVALAKLFAVDVPLELRQRFIPRLQFRRLLLQSRFPLARWPLLSIALLDYGNYRRGPGAEHQTNGHRNRTSTLPRAAEERPRTCWHITASEKFDGGRSTCAWRPGLAIGKGRTDPDVSLTEGFKPYLRRRNHRVPAPMHLASWA